ncbi:ABC transporter substrate-binding protein [Clostridium sp. 19966]|uniref:ABC transporter substrate-binding protein n=1 Tax=Clostridium sp. 19966 TaxID=2768166 RepID=UPI0028DDA402|nr:hypothetical protein [Clostridium sp. 19966]MDT8719472.1 ABC transporter substrate-binding protein [Clostridium sp. 19966]
MYRAFKGGTGDFATIFEPTASTFAQSKTGYIEASVGTSAGVIPYTGYFATKSYISKHKDIIQKFTNAIYKGQLWVQKHTDSEVANSIKSFFPGTDVNVIASTVKNYRGIQAFATEPTVSEESLNRLMDIIQSYDPSLLKERPPFNDIINNSFGENAIKNIK